MKKPRQAKARPQGCKAGQSHRPPIREGERISCSFPLGHRDLHHREGVLDGAGLDVPAVMGFQRMNEFRDGPCILQFGEADNGFGHAGTREGLRQAG